MRREFVALFISGIAVCGTVASSAQSKPRLAFEVASVHAYKLEGFRNQYRMTDGRVDLIRPLGSLLMTAFRHATYYRIAAPEWVNEVYVEIHATMPAGATVQQVPEMLQTLLEERFGLVTHREARPTDAYELLVAEGGIKMREVAPLNELDKETHADPQSGQPQRQVSAGETPDGIVRRFQVPGGGFTRLTSRTLYERRTIHDAGSIITATRMSMGELVSELEIDVDKPIIDKTGLNGVYQFTVQLPRGELLERLLRTVGAARAEPSGGGVSVFKELERLGLKLEKRRVPVEMIVVDKIARTPTEN